jgi:hypothetical protein
VKSDVKLNSCKFFAIVFKPLSSGEFIRIKCSLPVIVKEAAASYLHTRHKILYHITVFYSLERAKQSKQHGFKGYAVKTFMENEKEWFYNR